MKEFPKGGIVGKIVGFARYVTGVNISAYSASACYFIVLSIFPALVLLLGLLRYTGLSVDTLTEILGGVLPDALLPAAQKLIISTYRSSTGTVISLSALTALWSASRGIYGLLTGLNSIYEVAEDRGYWYTRGMSVFYTFAFLIVLLLTLVLHVFGTTIIEWLPVSDSPLFTFLANVVDLRFFLLLGLQTLLFTVMFMFLPNRRNRFMESLPGALLSSIGWLVFSDIFSIYVENFNSYANIYGSVYAVALGMLWLYSCVCIIFFGGVLNHWLSKDGKL